MVLKKTLESHLGFKNIKPVNPKGNQTWIFIGRTIAEAEAPIIWPPDVKSQLIEKDPGDGKDWRQKDKRGSEGMLDSITDSMDMNLSKLQELVEDRGAWNAMVHGIKIIVNDLSTEQQQQMTSVVNSTKHLKN